MESSPPTAQAPKSPSSLSIMTSSTDIYCNCGGPIAFMPPPQSPTGWLELSPPLNYRPIRVRTINLPPNNNSQAITLAPVPQSQKVLSISSPFHFQSPSKKIHSLDDIRAIS
ncbi:hypothetical protein SLA2020_167690 [Shorea laevis]